MNSKTEVRVLDHTGTLVGIISDQTFLKYMHRVNYPGAIQIQMRGDHPMASQIGLDYFLQVRRSVLDQGIDWYTEGLYFARTSTYQDFENGRSNVTFYGTGLLSLLMRRLVLYYANTSFTDKSGAGETVIKQIVDENAGPGASNASRLRNGVTPNLTLEPDQARGIAWSGGIAWKNVLDTIQEISLATGVYFDVLYPDPSTLWFLFRCYEGLRGTDRRFLNINRTTGLNAAGNSPLVFGLLRGNMISPSLSKNYDEEANVAVALGQGVEDARAVAISENAISMALSPWNTREVSTNAVAETDDAALQLAADVLLSKKVAITDFNFNVLQTPACMYGRDYTWGDFVTGEYRGTQRDVYVNKVTITVQEGENEKIECELGDIP